MDKPTKIKPNLLENSYYLSLRRSLPKVTVLKISVLELRTPVVTIVTALLKGRSPSLHITYCVYRSRGAPLPM